jgi:hypothetical protein
MRIPSTLKRFLLRSNLYPESRYQRALQREFDLWDANGRRPPSPTLFKQKIVQQFGRTHGLGVLVETGTYMGAMVQCCQTLFSQIYSVELQKDYYQRARRRFSRVSHVIILPGDSAQQLPEVLRKLNQPALFWLDAHYSGDLTAKANKETPVMQELALILGHNIKGHVILVDDARCFDGTHDYPTHETVSKIAASVDYSFSVTDDVMRLVPPSRSLHSTQDPWASESFGKPA